MAHTGSGLQRHFTPCGMPRLSIYLFNLPIYSGRDSNRCLFVWSILILRYELNPHISIISHFRWIEIFIEDFAWDRTHSQHRLAGNRREQQSRGQLEWDISHHLRRNRYMGHRHKSAFTRNGRRKFCRIRDRKRAEVNSMYRGTVNS